VIQPGLGDVIEARVSWCRRCRREELGEELNSVVLVVAGGVVALSAEDG
jgi:hypothetical protein